MGGKLRVRLLFALYSRRLMRRPSLTAGCVGPAAWLPGMWPVVGADQLVVSNLGSTRAVLASTPGLEEGLAFVSVSTQCYFGAVAGAWVGDPLGHVLRGHTPVVPLDVNLEDLVCMPSAGDEVEPAHLAFAGQWLSFVRWSSWQPGIGSEDAGDIFNFWLVRGLTQGQARVSQVLAGYYLSLLQAQFRCRVGLHIACLPAMRRGDTAFVRLMMARWRWTTFWAGSRDLLAAVLLCLLLCLRTCNARGLARMLRFLLVSAGYFKHRALLVFLQRFTGAALEFLGMSSDLRGVVLQLRGKIGRRGLARKSKYTVSCGAVRPTPYSPCILWDYTQVPTITGVLGLNVALVF